MVDQTELLTNYSTTTDETYTPPTGPPPYLSGPAVQHLCEQGWVRIDLPTPLFESYKTLRQEVSEFFDRPSIDSKQHDFPAKHATEFGYHFLPGEKEYLTLRSGVKSSCTGLEEAAARFWSQVATILSRVLQVDLTEYLEIPSSNWDGVLLPSNKPGSALTSMPEDEAQICSGSLLRLFRYFAADVSNDEVSLAGNNGGGGASEHSDLGILTLCIGQRGLECFDYLQRKYVDVLDAPIIAPLPPVSEDSPSARGTDQIGAVILIGQTLRGLLHRHLPAGMHRVKVPAGQGRQSMVFALRHGFGEIDLRPWGLGDEKVKARDLYEWLDIGRVSVNVTREVREQQLQDLAHAIKGGRG